MICTGSLYESCQALFADYPLAVDTTDQDGQVVPSIVLMLREVEDARFFTLLVPGRRGQT